MNTITEALGWLRWIYFADLIAFAAIAITLAVNRRHIRRKGDHT